tara:strand:- start:154 stop:567 length:414 start_codon:yes stop_codon:yes gene_type:complete
MKKLFLATVFVLTSIFASAQFTVVTTLNTPAEGESFEVSSITDNLGVGYQVSDKLMVGAVKNGEDYDLFGRYNVGTVYLSLQAPTDSTMTDNMNIGVGYSLCIYKNLYIEPNYTMPMSEDSEGNREGSFKLGVAYRF